MESQPEDTIAASNPLTECWNEIGVGGDASCPELTHCGHCRNCPVYAKAGARFFDRTIPAGYREDWTQSLRKEKAIDRAQKASLIVFRIADEWLALPTTLLREVVAFRPMHQVPRRSGRVLLGLINIRGEIQLCVSLTGLFGVEAKGDEGTRNDSSTRLMVIERGGEVWVFPVDQIHGTHRIQEADIVSAPATVERSARRFTRGVIALENLQVGVLDEHAIFTALQRGIG